MLMPHETHFCLLACPLSLMPLSFVAFFLTLINFAGSSAVGETDSLSVGIRRPGRRPRGRRHRQRGFGRIAVFPVVKSFAGVPAGRIVDSAADARQSAADGFSMLRIGGEIDAAATVLGERLAAIRGQSQ